MARHNAFGAVAAGILTSVLGVVGFGVGMAGMLGPPRSVQIGWLVPLIGVSLQLDPLGGFFIALTGAVAVPVGVYAIGYARREQLGAVPLSVLPLFVAAMMLVPAAASVSTFLLAWELMAAASLILVAAQHARPAVRQAAVFYAVMTQLGFVAILLGLMVLSAAGGADRFADLSAIPAGARTAVFVLT
ncbi:MAG: proton-conducting transporter membrane subunit, partial [Mycobacterium sp.]